MCLELTRSPDPLEGWNPKGISIRASICASCQLKRPNQHHVSPPFSHLTDLHIPLPPLTHWETQPFSLGCMSLLVSTLEESGSGDFLYALVPFISHLSFASHSAVSSVDL